MNLLIYGTRKQGKSTLALALATMFHRRVVAWDPNNQYPVVARVPLWDGRDAIFAHNRLPALTAWLAGSHPGSQRWELVRVGPFDTEDLEENFHEFFDALQHERDISIIVDESHMLQRKGYVHPSLDRWNRRSPADVALIQTTHRIVDASPDSRYHADHVFFFYAYLPRELKAIRENFGDDVARIVPQLERHQVLHWHKSPGGLPVYNTWPNPNDWYIDLENRNA